MNFEDLLYEVRNGVAWITINRPDKMNAFRGTTCDELIKALNKAGYDRGVGCIVLAGAGERAFCTGGDQSAHDGNYDGRGTIGLPMEDAFVAELVEREIPVVPALAIGGCTLHEFGGFRFAVFTKHGGRAPELTGGRPSFRQQPVHRRLEQRPRVDPLDLVPDPPLLVDQERGGQHARAPVAPHQLLRREYHGVRITALGEEVAHELLPAQVGGDAEYHEAAVAAALPR